MITFKEFFNVFPLTHYYAMQHMSEGPQNTWTWIRHRMESMKVSELDAHHRKIAIRLSRVVNKRTEVLLFHPYSFDLLILQKKVVGRDLPDAVDWKIIEK